MTIDPVSALAASASDMPTAQLEAQRAQMPFSSWLSGQVQQVNDRLSHADMLTRQLAVGDAPSIHQVMIALEKARLSLELLVQVRDKALDAYQTIMQMQV
jgi:flagellar hook-basal body complex protein FliE